MSRDKYDPLVVRINEDVAFASLFYFHGEKNEDNEKQDIIINIEFEAIVPSIKKSFFHQRMVSFVNKLE